ncbi:MAG: hypothetical protein methR_P1737 [Methyloprofundus sp.]|nr:MAG: hypothetical protein methR_P1737 [Methyloprofundus sp.]
MFKIISALLLSCSLNVYAAPNYVSDFADQTLNDWQTKSFKGSTQYQVTQLNTQNVLEAVSNQSASSLYKNMRIDLQKTPYLNWSWRIDKRLSITNEQSKQGDDFAARIYLIIKGEWFFWQTKAINYVWSSHHPKQASWPNPFAGENVMMLALRNNTDNTAQWYTEKRNVLVDLQQVFGEPIQYIDGIAIMTDTDNASGNAHSYYSHIYFSEQ